MPSSVILCNICFCNDSCLSNQFWDKGKPYPCRFAIRAQARKAGPPKKSFKSCAVKLNSCCQTTEVMASCPVNARGRLIPWRAIQSISFSHLCQSHHT
nr:hypothetical protein Iba_chr04dCG11040 [Ipomoea batatas]